MADHGIDVSNHQATAARSMGARIDWPAVRRNGIAYGWVKCTENGGELLYVDPFAGELADGMRGVGIPAGGYHFARPGDARQQAREFAAAAGRLGLLAAGSIRPMLDVEDTGVGDLYITAWIAEFRAVTGVRRVIVYANRSFWSSRLHPDPAPGVAGSGWVDDDVLLMLADYDGDLERVQWTHRRLAVKQHTEAGNVAGFPTRIDKDVTVNGYTVSDLYIEGNDDVDLDRDTLELWGGGEPVTLRNTFRSIQGLLADVHQVLTAPIRSASDTYDLAPRDLWRYVDFVQIKVDQVTRILADAAEHGGTVTMSPEQLDALRAQLDTSVDDMAAKLTAQVEAMAGALSAKLGVDHSTVVDALREFYGHAVDQAADTTPAVTA